MMAAYAGVALTCGTWASDRRATGLSARQSPLSERARLVPDVGGPSEAPDLGEQSGWHSGIGAVRLDPKSPNCDDAEEQDRQADRCPSAT